MWVAWSIGVLLTAVLFGLPYAPWKEVNGPLGGSLDVMQDRFKELFARRPLPPISRFGARDGSQLAIRLYKASENESHDESAPHVVLHHGSAGDSSYMHPLSLALQERGINVYTPDIRGHGESITSEPGDLDYMWQNLHDLEDLMKHFDLPPSRTVFVGFSAQGGAAWHLASIPAWQSRFAGFVAIAPFLGRAEEVIFDPPAAQFAHGNIPRLIALVLLNAFGISYFNHQSVMRFYIQPTTNVEEYVWQDSYNMAASHAPMGTKYYVSALADIPTDTRVLSLSAGADELFRDRTPLLQPLFPTGEHVTIPSVSHIGILFDESAADRTADFVKRVVASEQ